MKKDGPAIADIEGKKMHIIRRHQDQRQPERMP
jgi:hypothetical protein